MKCFLRHFISSHKQKMFSPKCGCVKSVFIQRSRLGAAVAIYCDAGTILFIIDDKYVILADMKAMFDA